MAVKPTLKEFSFTQKLMGNTFTITLVTRNHISAKEQFKICVDEIQRIEQMFTTYSNDSETNLVNRNAGLAPVKVSAEFFALVERCYKISVITQGAFDISYGSIDKNLWNFNNKMEKLPTSQEALNSVHLINYNNILIDRNAGTVFLKYKNMRIGFGGIGKGYAAEKVKNMMKVNLVSGGLVNASGDIAAWGNQANDKPWTIGIASPDKTHKAFSYLNISNKAVATSGNYEKYITIQGKKYSHTINPKTGLPISGIKSVTVIAENAEFADAMATPISVMGVEAGLFLINQLPNVHCIIIDDHDKIFTSNKINLC